MIVYSRILKAFRDTLAAALPGVLVERGRRTAIPEAQSQAVIVGLALIQGQTYTVGSDVDWQVSVRLDIGSRDGDEDAAALHAQVHAALIADKTLGVANLYVDPAFQATDAIEDWDTDLAVVSATYTCQIATGGSSAEIS